MRRRRLDRYENYARGIPGMELEKRFNFAWNVVGGINLSPDWFLQVRWLVGSNPSDDGILATEIGFRF